MNKFYQVVNDVLRENADSEIDTLMRKKFDDKYPVTRDSTSPYDEPGATDLRDRMMDLGDEIFAAINAKDKEAHLVSLQKYEDLRDEAISKFGLDGPVGLIDPDMHGEYSDDFKSAHGIRPRSDALNTFRSVIEFYPDNRYGKIVDGQFIAPELKSYIGVEHEDQESGIRSLDGFFSDEEAHIEDQEVDMNTVEKGLSDLAATASSGAKGLAGKLLGTKAQAAKASLDKRAKAVAKAIPAYDAVTKKLEQGYKDLLKTAK